VDEKEETKGSGDDSQERGSEKRLTNSVQMNVVSIRYIL